MKAAELASLVGCLALVLQSLQILRGESRLLARALPLMVRRSFALLLILGVCALTLAVPQLSLTLILCLHKRGVESLWGRRVENQAVRMALASFVGGDPDKGRRKRVKAVS